MKTGVVTPQVSEAAVAGQGTRRACRLAILASHVIQYQDPFFRYLAVRGRLEIEVFFCSDWGYAAYRDRGFQQEVRWDIEVLRGYSFQFLRNVAPAPDASRFWGAINPGIIEKLRKGRFDALLAHGWSRCSNWIAMLAARVLGIRILMRAETNLLNPSPFWKRMLKKGVLVPLFRNVYGFLAIGSGNVAFYRAFGVPEEKIFLAPYAVDNGFFLGKADELRNSRRAIRERLGIPVSLPVILFCGKLSQVKRPLDLLQAFERLQCEASLMFVGDGPLRPDLEKYVATRGIRNVHFAGFQNQSALPLFFTAADIFVLPSGCEPWGLVVNEAMCFGLPLVVSDRVGAAADLVRIGENGFVYSCGHVGELRDLVAGLVRDSARRLEMGRNSRARIQSWGYRQYAEAVEACLEGVLVRS